MKMMKFQRDGYASDESTPSRTVFNQVDRADDVAEDSGKEARPCRHFGFYNFFLTIEISDEING